MPTMEDFERLLIETLQARPGMTRERLAAAMKFDHGDEFREKLSQACDKDIIHKVQDRYYPGTRKSY
jgi:hypothetical protein